MLMYVFIFFVIGFLISKFFDEKKAFIIIIIIAIIWSFVDSIMWGLVSFGEMALGYFVVRFLKD